MEMVFSNINLHDLIKFHSKNKKLVTMTGVLPQGRFGAVEEKKFYCSKFQRETNRVKFYKWWLFCFK